MRRTLVFAALLIVGCNLNFLHLPPAAAVAVERASAV
jgi:hypothetical protein